ncbi:hypothetical protein [Streptomyces sp. WAC01280]|uniref:hypothetical protein n=1 Tax=Streptomyces sp. WAC01280 TaxID=2487424 RepID=UPI00163C3E8C|nr:hypothetical protein [Streptomyces sp. WAC01280]
MHKRVHPVGGVHARDPRNELTLHTRLFADVVDQTHHVECVAILEPVKKDA